MAKEKSNIPKCFYCDKPMKPSYDSIAKKVTGYVFKFDCDCVKKHPKLNDLRMCIG